jgi:hypothetical protein
MLMIRNYNNAEKISDNILKIKARVKNMYLCINYEKGIEKGIEIEVQLKFPEIAGHFLLYEKNSNSVFRIVLTDTANCVSPIEIPSSEEILININYIGEDSEGYVDIFPLYYKS